MPMACRTPASAPAVMPWGQSLIMQAGQVFSLHMILMDSDAGQAMTLGHSVLVGESGVERLSRHGLGLILNV